MPIRIREHIGARPAPRLRISAKPVEDLNTKRRRRYREDPAYRAKVMKQARNAYRMKVGVERETCLRSLDFLEALATTTRVLVPISPKHVRGADMPVLTLSGTADALQKMYQTVWRWVKHDMIPKPALKVQFANDTWVYHVDEVRAFVEIIGMHERDMSYYRASHKHVREKLFARISFIRSKWR